MIKYKRDCEFLGRNGTFKQSGVAVYDGFRETILITPLTSKEVEGRCRIEIPAESAPEVISELQSVLNKFYFKMPSHWKKAEAIKFAESKGLKTFDFNENTYIQVKWEKARLHWEDGEPFEGYVQVMRDWNGWEMPVFKKEEAKKIVLANPDTLKWDGDKIIAHDYNDDTEEVIECVCIGAIDGEIVWGYDLSLGWTWSKE